MSRYATIQNSATRNQPSADGDEHHERRRGVPVDVPEQHVQRGPHATKSTAITTSAPRLKRCRAGSATMLAAVAAASPGTRMSARTPR
jgi:hypothetical protein